MRWNALPYLFWCVYLFFLPQAHAETVGETIDGVVSRAGAIVSGRFSYVCSIQNFKGDRPLDSRTFPESTVSLFDGDWAERNKSGTLILVNRNGYFLDYSATAQPDGSIAHRVQMEPPRNLSSRREMNAPPLFAGTFWYPQHLKYVASHVANARLVERTQISGVPTDKIELRVPKEDYRKAYHYLIPALEQGGIIRFYVARQLGYVLPRIELVSLDGAVTQSYEATEFSQVAPGIFFPGKIALNTELAAGGPSPNRFHVGFTIRAELVNQAIPESDFVVPLPMSTAVHDARDQEHPFAFKLSGGITSDTLIDQSVEQRRTKPTSDLRRWKGAVGVGLFSGSVIAIAFVLTSRWRRRSRLSKTI